MDFVRTVDWDAAHFVMDPGYKGYYLYWGDICNVIATKVEPGAHGPDLHTHPSDQYFFIVEGELTLDVSGEARTLASGELAFIPANTPHCVRNLGDVREIHLEIIAPGIPPTQSVATPADKPAIYSDSGWFVSAAARSRVRSHGDEPAWLADRSRGADSAAIYVAENPGQTSGPGLHVHDFTQFYFVLGGVLSVQIGLKCYEAGPLSLVVLPAQSPHRQWNAHVGPEQHVAILVPGPPAHSEATSPRDVAVDLVESTRSVEAAR